MEQYSNLSLTREIKSYLQGFKKQNSNRSLDPSVEKLLWEQERQIRELFAEQYHLREEASILRLNFKNHQELM